MAADTIAHSCSEVEPEIRRAISLLVPDGILEIRQPDAKASERSAYKGTRSGYFSCPEKAVKEVALLDAQALGPGIYMTIQRIDPALLARCPDYTKHPASQTTGKQDITWLRWLFFDIDPERPSGIGH